jgi:hypothetical protein
MGSQINELVKMRDFDTLYEIMSEDEDWMLQLDAAEGLVALGDKRGLEFLLETTQSEYKDMRQVAKEILESPDVKRMRDEMEAEERYKHRARVEKAKTRLQKSRKVFRHKIIYIPAEDLLSEDTSGDGFSVPMLDEVGLEGWELVSYIPRRRQLLTGSMDDHFSGAYFLLKKEVEPDESDELDEF